MQLKVQVWIHFLNEKDKCPYFLLLQTRPDRGAFWQPVTGSVEEGESLEQAALREAHEETGLSFVSPFQTIPFQFEYQGRWGGAREFGFGVEIQPYGDGFPAVKIDPREHSDSRWVTSEQAFSMLGYPSNAQMLEAYLKLL